MSGASVLVRIARGASRGTTLPESAIVPGLDADMVFVETTWHSLEAARRAVGALARTPALNDRDGGFVEQAVRAGAFDALTRTQALRRLEESGRRVDTAVHDLRVARAAWIRRAGGN